MSFWSLETGLDHCSSVPANYCSWYRYWQPKCLAIYNSTHRHRPEPATTAHIYLWTKKTMASRKFWEKSSEVTRQKLSCWTVFPWRRIWNFLGVKEATKALGPSAGVFSVHSLVTSLVLRKFECSKRARLENISMGPIENTLMERDQRVNEMIN